MAVLLLLTCSVFFFPNVIPFTFGRKFLPQLGHMMFKIHSVFTAVSAFPHSAYYVYANLRKKYFFALR